MIETAQYATGKRKYAVARAWIEPGSGEIQVNNKLLDQYFPRQAHQMQVRSPFEITGTASGVNRDGYAYDVFIETPLVLDKICPWLVSGVLTLTVDNLDVSLDYGTGNCDNKALLTLPNGTTHEIVIARWW